jgi:hypothetical protein
MLNIKNKKVSFRIFFFPLLFWVIGVITAFFVGLGWFFFFESLRRVLTYIPPFERMTRKILVGQEGQAEYEKEQLSSKSIDISTILRLMITLGWFIITIVVFLKINIPLLELF